MQNSRLKDIYAYLKSKGYDVYFPGQKVGECKKQYLVVRDDGLAQFQQLSSNRQLYSILVYVPLARYGDLEPLVNRLEEDMKGMHPMIASMHFRTPSFQDDSVKAHMISTQYRNIKTM